MQKSNVGGGVDLTRINILQAAKVFGITRQSLGELLRVHCDEAPKRGEDGLFDFNELRQFYEGHGKIRTPQELKVRVLEEELRLKKVKADEAEARVISRDTMLDDMLDLDITLEAVLKGMARKCAKDKKTQEILYKEAKNQFGRWRKKLEELDARRLV